MAGSSFQSIRDQQEAAAFGEALRASRAADSRVALKRLASEVRSCRALGCAEAWKIAPDPFHPDQWVLTLALPSKAFADRLEETLHGVD